MFTIRANRPILELPELHPAHRFLRAFVECRRDCVGKELPWPEQGVEGVDQKWVSKTDGKRWEFSAFMYRFIATDIVLDGWLQNPPTMTPNEKYDLERLPLLCELMQECHEAAVRDGNARIVQMTTQVLKMLELWELSIRLRIKS